MTFDTSHEIFNAAEGGDRVAQGVFNTMARYLGVTLAGLINVLNPEMVIIGGGVAAAWEVFIEPLSAEVAARAFEAPAKRAQLTRSALGDKAGLLGVARSTFQSFSARS